MVNSENIFMYKLSQILATCSLHHIPFMNGFLLKDARRKEEMENRTEERERMKLGKSGEEGKKL